MVVGKQRIRGSPTAGEAAMVRQVGAKGVIGGGGGGGDRGRASSGRQQQRRRQASVTRKNSLTSSNGSNSRSNSKSKSKQNQRQRSMKGRGRGRSTSTQRRAKKNGRDGSLSAFGRNRSASLRSKRSLSLDNSIRKVGFRRRLGSLASASNPSQPTSMMGRKPSSTSTPTSGSGNIGNSSMRASPATRAATQTPKKNFHVRITLGYVTGLMVEQKNRKRNFNNSLVVGYAALYKSPAKLAVSQPISSTIGDDARSKHQKIIWMSGRGKASPAAGNKMRRRLQFCVQLDHEDDTFDDIDDDSKHSIAPYVPEVVKLVIGIKCGDQSYNLGIANLVISGNNVANQKVDMAVRAVNAQGTRSRQRKGLFSKKMGGGVGSDGKATHGNFTYGLAPNSAFRVRLDVQEGNPGDTEAFFDMRGDDESYTTKFSLDRSFTGSSIIDSQMRSPPGTPQHFQYHQQQQQQYYQQQHLQQHNSERQRQQQQQQNGSTPIQRSFVSPHAEPKTSPMMSPFMAPFMSSSPKNETNDWNNQAQTQAQAQRLAQGQHHSPANHASAHGTPRSRSSFTGEEGAAPFDFLVVKMDDMSVVSSLTKSMRFTNPFQCLTSGMCGSEDGTTSNLRNGGSHESTDESSDEDDDDEDDDDGSSSWDHESVNQGNDRTLNKGRHTTRNPNTPSGNSRNRNRLRNLDRGELRVNTNIAMEGRDDAPVLSPQNRKKPLQLPNKRRPPGGNAQNSDDLSATDLTHETMTDLRDAQVTLRRYADKVGISMEELLEGRT